MHAPIPYAENDEKISRNERTTHKKLAKTFRRIISTTHRDTHHAERGVHAKGHALLKGEISIHPDLPDELAQGLFATPKTYPAFVRLSTIPGDVLKDSVSVPRGFALKITNIDGELLADAKETPSRISFSPVARLSPFLVPNRFFTQCVFFRLRPIGRNGRRLRFLAFCA